MGTVLAFVNMKGGVGKTTASVLVAETLARYGKSVLFIDLDAQASATFAIAGYETLRRASDEKKNLVGFMAQCVLGPPPRLDKYLVEEASTLTDCGALDLACSHPELRIVERELARKAARQAGMLTNLERTLQKARKPLFDEIRRLSNIYEYVIVDCPPGISLFVEAGVFAADAIVCPTEPEPLATLGLETIISRVYGSEWFLNELVALKRPTPPFRILFSKVDAGNDFQRAEIDRVETLVEKLDWTDQDIAIVDDELEASPVLAAAFRDPDLERAFADRYAGFERRAADITNAVLDSATRRAAAA